MDGDAAAREASASREAVDDAMQITVKASAGGQRESETVRASMTVAELKKKLEPRFGCDAVQMRLIYKGKVLQDGNTLSSYGLQAEHTVHLVKSPTRAGSASGGGNAAPAAASAATAMGSAQQQGIGGGGNGGGEGGMGMGMGMGGLGGAFGGGGFGDMGQMRDMMPDPAAMEEMLGSTMFQNMMDDPEMIRGIISTNPQLRDLVDRNPELAHVLNDPSTLRQAMEMARNPELMREQMRSTDRAMANIEGHPEGFNMLRRMYENVQEPLLNATERRDDRSNSNTNTANPFASLFAEGSAAPGAAIPSGDAPNTDPLPNPWAPRNDAAAGGGGGAAAAAAGRNAGFPSMGGAQAAPFGLPGFPGAPGGMDPAAITQMLENPAMQGMMQRILSDPATFESMMAANPQMREMMAANPHMRQMMQDPAVLRSLSDPNTMRSLLNIQREIQQQPNLGALFGMMGGAGAGAGAGMGMGGSAAPPPAPVQDPATTYARQLQQLQDMGFFDRDANIRALQAVHGNVNAAVERLLSGL